MDFNTRMSHMGKQLIALVVITAVLSVGGIVTSLGLLMDGEAYGYSRVALGVLGIAGAVLILVGSDYGKLGLTLVMAWGLVQSVYYATEPGGNFTRQLFDALAGASTSTTINGEVTEFSAIGLNLVGVAMFAFAYACRKQSGYWKNRANRGFAV